MPPTLPPRAVIEPESVWGRELLEGCVCICACVCVCAVVVGQTPMLQHLHPDATHNCLQVFECFKVNISDWLGAAVVLKLYSWEVCLRLQKLANINKDVCFKHSSQLKEFKQVLYNLVKATCIIGCTIHSSMRPGWSTPLAFYFSLLPTLNRVSATSTLTEYSLGPFSEFIKQDKVYQLEHRCSKWARKRLQFLNRK